jgi:hypothetical protein
MALLPGIPADGSFEEIIALLGLSKDWIGGSVSSTHCDMAWDIAPGYRFCLSFDPVFEDGTRALLFTGAGFSAQNKPGFRHDEYHTVYPYRARKGMAHSPDEVIRLTVR